MRPQWDCKDKYEEEELEKFGTHGVKGDEENSCVRFSQKEGIRGVQCARRIVGFSSEA